MQIDEALFTRKRVMITTRPPKFAVADPAKPWVMLEAEDGSGLTLALMGPDSAEARADAARMMKLWNDSLEANGACPGDRKAAAEDQPDYEGAFRRVCADMGAINALLGFDDHPGIDRVLREITVLKLAGGAGAIRDAGDGPRLRSETIQRVERGVHKLLVDAQHPAGGNTASAPPAGWRVYPKAPEFFPTEAEAMARVRENRKVNGWPESYAEPADQAAARARNTMAKNVYRGIDALRWLLNITTEFDRKDVRTRQAARLLDEFFSADGITNRDELEHLWKTLYSELSHQDKLDCLREPDSRKASAESDHTLKLRAVEIADQSMVELLLAHAVRFDALTPAFGLSSENGTEVQTLEEADPAIQEAFEWLQLRDMAELMEESGGACILLKGHALEHLNLDTGQTLQ
ncbi:hypothetical protein LMG22037_06365 [Paraburkholderia phenoliruptrix]|uniref:Uncharacterized protein n=3 Tax=Bacteria TaxID=2 RepID=A0A6J5CL98_9BURK|nr:hypothetical protein [Paraburkholderia phenoliruptrix]CAB3740158.1 hypothetical protein LMG22037_06365 [Paraburkholderia phenoliruptrix]